ncbi:MAG: cya 1, partial [Ramlibacter sp.]|nr:cya 1 [Ramlibacter sp.]
QLIGGVLQTVTSTYVNVGGNDQITGDAGSDWIVGGAADDTIDGNEDVDYILGDSGELSFTNGDLRTITSTGSNVGGSDTIHGNDGADMVVGGTSGDFIHGDSGSDLLLGDEGTIQLIGGVLQTVTSTYVNVGGNDQITGDAGSDWIVGGAANDTIDGNDAVDYIVGDSAQLTYVGGDLRTLVSTGDGIGGADTIHGNDGADIVIGGAAGDELHGDAGNDLIYGDEATVSLLGGIVQSHGAFNLLTVYGDDVIEGGTGNDLMYGEQGSDRYVFSGALLGDDILYEANGWLGRDRLDFTEFAGTVTIDLRKSTRQIVDPVHLALTLQIGAAIEDLTGSQHDDVIFGNDQGNQIDALAGNDIVFGGYGDDTISGGEGDDIVLGDEGMVRRMAGQPVEVVLLDVGEVTGRRDLSSYGGLSTSLLGEELWLVTGTQDAWGRWSTSVLTVNLMPAGNDVIAGDAGNDLLFGQAGNDRLSGGEGDDYIEGNEGNDVASGGAGADILIGDNSYHFATTEESLPIVAHAYGLGRGVEGALAAIVSPGTTVMPVGVHALDPFGSVLYQGDRDMVLLNGLTPYRDTLGRTHTTFAAVLPDVGRHASYLAGNDTLSGDAGSDRLVGDHSIVVAPFQSGLTGLLADFGSAMQELARIDRVLPPQAVPAITVASDQLSGGADDDLLIGDSSLVLVGNAGYATTLASGLANAADDFEDAVDRMGKYIWGTQRAIDFTSSRDTLSGGEGDDRLVGDFSVGVTVAVDAEASGTPSWLSLVKLPSLTITGAVDVLNGDAGDDELAGDSQLLVAVGIGTGPFDAERDVLLDLDDSVAGEGPADVVTLPFTPTLTANPATVGSGYRTLSVGELLGQVTLRGAADTLNGGDGDDRITGDDTVEVSVLVDGPLAANLPATHYDRNVVVSGLVDRITLIGAADQLNGGSGDDLLVGDSSFAAHAFAGGPLSLGGDGHWHGHGHWYWDWNHHHNDHDHHDDWHGHGHGRDQVRFSSLVDDVVLVGAADTLNGGTGDDTLVGDHHVTVAAIVGGPVLAGEGATLPSGYYQGDSAVAVDGIVGNLTITGAADLLQGSDGNDRLVGDSALRVVAETTGPLLTGTAAFASGYGYGYGSSFEALVDFDGIVRNINASGGNDTLQGDAGDDSLIGDDTLTIAGIVGDAVVLASAGGGSYSGRRLFDGGLVEFDGLVCSVDLCGGNDVLTGGTGNDELIGDQQVKVVAAVAGPLFQAEAGVPAPTASVWWSSQRDEPVEFENMVGSIGLHGGNDTLNGSEGNDRLTGDADLLVSAVIHGAMVEGFEAPTPGWNVPNLTLLEFDTLVSQVDIAAGCDILSGGDGNDLLAGDSTLVVNAIIGGAAGSGSTMAPALRLYVEIDQLLGHLHAGASVDTLRGDLGNDDLVGDNVLTAGIILTGGQAVDAVKIAVHSLAKHIELSGANDRLEGGDGNDRLTGDNDARISGVRLQDGAGTRTIAIDSVVCDLDLDAGCDMLLGGVGDDVLIGDQEIVVAGAVAEGQVAGDVGVNICSLVDSLALGAGEDTLDGGAGNDILTGDQLVAVAGLVDARTSVASGAQTGTFTLQVTELLGFLSLGADDDVLTGGIGDDLIIGDSQMSVSAFRGAFATPITTSVQLTGTRLVDELQVKAGRDTLRGGDGNDSLVGDSDATVAVQAGGMGSGLMSALTRLIEKLTVSSNTDDIKGDLGTNTIEQGNRASAAAPLVKTTSISAKGTGTPQAPVIDWNGRLDADVPASSSSGWLESFANGLGRNSDPNKKIRIKL